MLYDYDRKSFCLIRWAAYLIGILLLLADCGRISALLIGGAFACTCVGVRWDKSLAMRYKWYGILWVIYYLALIFYTYQSKGELFFQSQLSLLLFIVPFFPEVILYEIKEYRGY
jgi:hypothetical protein